MICRSRRELNRCRYKVFKIFRTGEVLRVRGESVQSVPMRNVLNSAPAICCPLQQQLLLLFTGYTNNRSRTPGRISLLWLKRWTRKNAKNTPTEDEQCQLCLSIVSLTLMAPRRLGTPTVMVHRYNVLCLLERPGSCLFTSLHCWETLSFPLWFSETTKLPSNLVFWRLRGYFTSRCALCLE